MTQKRMVGLLLVLLSGGLSVIWGFDLERASSVGPIDFEGIYYGARCLLQDRDPYKTSEVLQVYLADGWKIASNPDKKRVQLSVVGLQGYLPTTYPFIAPFTMLPWKSAHLLWMILSAGSLIFSALLIWNLAAEYAPAVAVCLTGFILANSEDLLAGGNPAAITTAICVIAVWCFLRERFVWAGVLCLAASLAIKPHDAGLVWLYFLLAGGVYRKRAVLTLVAVVVMCVPSVLWVSHVAPNWAQELHANLAAYSSRGNLNDPGSANEKGPFAIVDLQSAISIFRDDPRIYNPVTYLVCGTLLLVWTVKTIRSHPSAVRAWLALAAIAPLSMLPVYHRLYDTKLLLLTLPACAILWHEKGLIGRLALLINTVAFAFTGDISLATFGLFAGRLHLSTTGIAGKILTVLTDRPVPLILLMMSIFYLWVYVRRPPGEVTSTIAGRPNAIPIAPSTT